MSYILYHDKNQKVAHYYVQVDKAPRKIKYVVGNKFIHEGDEVDLNSESDEKEMNEKGEQK